jgi:subtilisin family serine protease
VGLNTVEGHDLFYIEASKDGINWDYVGSLWGTSNGWMFKSYSLTDYDTSPYLYIRFGLTSDGNTSSSSSVYIGDVNIEAFDPSSAQQNYNYLSGTSMAAPYVSGVAGLVESMHPWYTNVQIKDAILKGVDFEQSLFGWVLTAGRLNASKAVSAVAVPWQPFSTPTSQFVHNSPQHFERDIAHTSTADTQIAPYAVPYNRWDLWHQNTL